MVVADEGAVIEGRQDVPVHREERLVEPFDQAKRPRRAECLLFLHVRDQGLGVRSVIEDRTDEVREIAHGKGDVVNPCRTSWSTTISRIARSPTGMSGLGRIEVYGASRVPRPPARMTALWLFRLGRLGLPLPFRLPFVCPFFMLCFTLRPVSAFVGRPRLGSDNRRSSRSPE